MVKFVILVNIQKMRQLILVTILFFGFEVFGQETSRFKLGLIIAPNLVHRTLIEVESNDLTEFIIEHRNRDEIPKFGYNIGLNIDFNFSNNFSFETGIQYANKGFKTKVIDIYSIQPDPNTPINYQCFDSHHYMDIPLKINYTAGKNKIRFLASIGVSTNILIESVRKKTFTNLDGTVKSEKTGLNATTERYERLNVSPLISLGTEYQINKNISIKIEPMFSYGILKIIDTPISANLWSAGIQFGSYLRL